MNLNHKYSLVEFEPSGTVAQRQGLQDIWDICNCPGKLRHFKDDPLAHWHTLWHRWHAGTVDRPMVQANNDEHHSLNLEDSAGTHR